jgi:integrase
MAEIRKKGHNKFLVIVYMGRDTNGKRLYERQLFNGNEKQAKNWAIQWEADLKKRVGPTSVAMTVGEYLEKKWLPGIIDSISSRTHETYAYHVRRLKPLVGHLRMYNLNGMTLQDALPNGCFGNVKPKTVKGFYTTLKTALKQALAWGILSVDPTQGLRTPRVPKTRPKVLTVQELSRLLETAKQYKYYLVIRLLALTGARLGEILGLRWSDIDFSQRTMTIMRAANVRHRKEKDDAKTDTSPRRILLDAETLSLLALAKKAAMENKVMSPTGLIFHHKGRVVREDAIRRTMNYALKKAGFEHIKLHALRHTAGSILLDDGKSLAAVAEFLGHSSTATTAAVYAHAVRRSESISLLTHQSAHQNLRKQ